MRVRHVAGLIGFAVALALPSRADAGPVLWDILSPTSVTIPFGTPIELDVFLRPRTHEPLILDDVDWGYTLRSASPALGIQYPSVDDIHDLPRLGEITGVPLSPSLDGLTLVIPDGRDWPSGGVLFPMAYLTLSAYESALLRFQFHIGTDYATFDIRVSEGPAYQHGSSTQNGAPLPVPEPTTFALLSAGLAFVAVRRVFGLRGR